MDFWLTTFGPIPIVEDSPWFFPSSRLFQAVQVSGKALTLPIICV